MLGSLIIAQHTHGHASLLMTFSVPTIVTIHMILMSSCSTSCSSFGSASVWPLAGVAAGAFFFLRRDLWPFALLLLPVALLP